MNKIDLQIQSTASDGQHTPREILDAAKEHGLEVVALTDHDTVDGVPEAVLAGADCGIRVIPGVELSVAEKGSHLLGLGIDCQHAGLGDSLKKFQEDRILSGRKMVENLQGVGFVVDWEAVLRKVTGIAVPRVHISRAILAEPKNRDKLGAIESVYDFIQSYLTDESPHYVRHQHNSAKDSIALIHAAGGVAIWSHPAIKFYEDYGGLENFLKELLGWGLDGIEVFNPSHREDDVEFLEGICERYGLLRTAGSDFHSSQKVRSKDDRGLRPAYFPGDYETFGFSTKDIISRLDEAMAKRLD